MNFYKYFFFLLKTLIVVLPSIHNLCFGLLVLYMYKKIRKMFAPVNPSLTFRKVGFKGVYFSWTCYPDGSLFLCYYELCPLSAAMVMLGQSAVLSTLILEEPSRRRI